MKNFKYKKKYRLLKKSDYFKVIKAKNKISSQFLFINYRFSKQTKMGITVNKKFGKAILRNKFKRHIREAFRHLFHEFKENIEINVSPQKTAKTTSYKKLYKDLLNAISQIKILIVSYLTIQHLFFYFSAIAFFIFPFFT